MKKLLSALAGILFCAAAQAQTQNFLSLSIGSSTPLGAYAGNTDVARHGFAAPGSGFSLDFSRHKKALGWSFTISAANHQIQEQALLAALPDKNKPVRFNDSSQWMAACVMGGPAWQCASGRWSMELRVIGGFFFTKAPDAAFQSEVDLDTRYFKFNNNLFDCVGALGIQTGAVLRYRIWNRWHLNLRTHLYGSRPFYTIKSDYTPESGKPAVEYKFSQGTGIIDMLFGLAVKF